MRTNPKTLKVVYRTGRLLPKLLDTENTLRDWVIDTAKPEQMRFLNRTDWIAIYDYSDRTVYLLIDVFSEKQVTLANIYFG